MTRVYRATAWLSRWRPHWPLAVIVTLASLLLFTGLGRDYLWSDEGDTAVLGRAILKEGVPSAWDGRTFTDSDFGTRVNDDLVMVSHPWLQYYVAAASFAIFGDTAWAARAPFALFGLLTIVLVYGLTYRASRNVWMAASGALLLTLSVQFLLYARQSRYYTLSAALTCLMVLQFQRLESWRRTLVFALIAIASFHSHPAGLAPFAVLGVLTFVHRPFAPSRRWFWRAVPIVAAGTVPWLIIAQSGYALSTSPLQSASVFLPRLGQFLVECASVTSLPGAVVLALVAWRRRSSRQPQGRTAKPRNARPEPVDPGLLLAGERSLLILVAAIVAAYGIALALTQTRDALFTVGLRYTPAILPFAAVTGAILIARVSRLRWTIWVPLLLVFGFTKVARVTPWTFWEEPLAKRDPAAAITFHNPPRWTDRVFRTGQMRFVHSLFEPEVGTTGRVVEFLRTHANPGDIVVTNYGWEPLYFHTNLPQGMTVLPRYPIYQAARAQGLPEYVFRPEGARWIVWRRAWGAYRGQALDQLLVSLQAARVPVTRVASIPETLWENRENIHFRRFPGGKHVYPWFEQLPDTVIYRVDWGMTRPAG